MKKTIGLEDAARAMLGREHDNDDDETAGRKGVRPPSKITLPRVKWLDKPGPEWVEPPKPARKRGKA
jgi:hypothetical protein